MAQIGDLHNDNVKQILVELSVAPAATVTLGEEVPILDFSLSFKNSEGATAVLRSRMHTLMSDNQPAALAQPQDEQVAVALAIQEFVQTDTTVLQLAERGNRDSAIATKEKMIAKMRDLQRSLHVAADRSAVASTDEDGANHRARLARVLERAERNLSNLRDRGASVAERGLECRYEQRIQHAMSDCGYCSGGDSDDGNWSPDEDEDQHGAAVRGRRPRTPPSPVLLARPVSSGSSGSSESSFGGLGGRDLNGRHQIWSGRPPTPPPVLSTNRPQYCS